MRQEGTVSLWLGKATTEVALGDVLRVEYTRGGDFRGSAFSRAFELGRYDDAKREALRHEKAPSGLEEFLKGVSYEQSVVPALKLAGAELRRADNCYILLYDYSFEGPKTARWTSGGLSLRFAGASGFEADTSE